MMMDDRSLHPWLNGLIQSHALDQLWERTQGDRRTVVAGSRGSSTALLAGSIALRTHRPVLLVVAHPDEADEALEDLALCQAVNSALSPQRIAALEVLPGETHVSIELLSQRLHAVERLSQVNSNGFAGSGDRLDVWVAPIQALMQSVPTPEALARLMWTIHSGQRLAMGQLVTWLTNAGYERVDAIEQPGQFAVRGGIMDLYLPAGVGIDAATANEAPPVRLDFFGDTLESIHTIDPETLGSQSAIEVIQLIGATADQLQPEEQTTGFLSLLNQDTLVIMHELLELAEQARGYYERLTNPRGIYSPQAVFKALTAYRHIEVNQYSGVSDRDKPMRLPVASLAGFDHNAEKAVQQLAQLATGSDHEHKGAPGSPPTVVVLCQNEAQQDRLIELIEEYAPAALPVIKIELGYLHRGFVWLSPEHRSLHLVPHHELFHRYHTRRRFRPMATQAAGSGRATDAFLDVGVGDYVVHVDHGIARFVGIRTMRRKGKSEDYLTLQFAGDTLLHVPAAQIDLVQRYIGGFQGNPPLSQMGGKRWAKQKQQVTEAVKDLAAEMLRVQAARASLPGTRYPPDTPWQQKFEAEFPYQETQDQLAAIGAVKKDLNDPRPMDRLICGDVGFGKTEVAVRAAFKVIEYGKQVAVLVPTTVLAEQHERTFRERMADYPFRVASISRFKTAGESAKVLKDLANGQVDVIIGTHRLLSGDVKFADLGLVVVDEEQRFGVEHKQKLMQMRLTVEVLTLSATPIPRTLHMSMLGLRDISSLAIAPVDRRAIVTEVMAYDPKRIKQAIIRELNRDGQVYFVHNRVHSIDKIADEVRALVPDARVAVGHGQMPAHGLEQVMLAFMRRDTDVLVCTTIIESGLDIPTANTILIHDADRFGLADLHQLRGRVGRYKHRAYCYLMLPSDRPVTDTAAKRLAAIERYAMLGAGFKIAMRDLEIRGAGNLLGAQQSGHIAAVGYEMYCQLLEQAAKRLRQEPIVEPAKTHLELPIAGQLPKRYIGSDKLRIDAYRRLSRAATLEELASVVKHLTDAYGDPPEPAQRLFDITQLRVATTLVDVASIKLDGPDVIFRTPKPQKLEPLLNNAPGRVSVIDEQTIYWRPPTNYLEPPTLLAVLRKVMGCVPTQREAG